MDRNLVPAPAFLVTFIACATGTTHGTSAPIRDSENDHFMSTECRSTRTHERRPIVFLDLYRLFSTWLAQLRAWFSVFFHLCWCKPHTLQHSNLYTGTRSHLLLAPRALACTLGMTWLWIYMYLQHCISRLAGGLPDEGRIITVSCSQSNESRAQHTSKKALK